jgi:catechol 2,3-dioxygenase-like lactoylglutathione lyase family enzyme
MEMTAESDRRRRAMLSPRRIYETVLYAEDLAAAEAFYHEVLGLEIAQRSRLFFTARCGDGVLLVFDPRKSSEDGRDVPSHGARGPGHLAFAVHQDELDAWRAQLAEHGVAIEADVEWGDGTRSLYFRDPAGNSLELAPPTLWGDIPAG